MTWVPVKMSSLMVKMKPMMQRAKTAVSAAMRGEIHDGSGV